MGVSVLKVYFVCSRVTLTVFYCLMLLLVIIGAFRSVVDKNNILTADCEQSRIEYLNNLGANGVTGAVSCTEITIPYYFNEVYRSYNNLQIKAGYNLNLYKGQNVQLFTYQYDEYFIHLILIKGKIIGGDISERVYNGNVLPLKTESFDEINKT